MNYSTRFVVLIIYLTVFVQDCMRRQEPRASTPQTATLTASLCPATPCSNASTATAFATRMPAILCTSTSVSLINKKLAVKVSIYICIKLLFCQSCCSTVHQTRLLCLLCSLYIENTYSITTIPFVVVL